MYRSASAVTSPNRSLIIAISRFSITTVVNKQHRKNRIMAVSVVKLYLSDANTKQPAWAERVTGTATLTKDYGRKSYYIQIFEMQYYQQVLTYIFRLNVEL